MAGGNEAWRGNRPYWQLPAVLAAGLISLAAAGCSHHHHHEDVAVSTGYQYYYYPEEEIYYDPGVRVYYWHDHDHWRHGPHLPPYYHPVPERRVEVNVHSRHPYEMHEQIRAAHPPMVRSVPVHPSYGPGEHR